MESRISVNDIYVEEKPFCWPIVILIIIGLVLTLYSAIASSVEPHLRIFGSIIIVLWTIVWSLILWILWKEDQISIVWWLLLIPISIITIFFIFVVL